MQRTDLRRRGLTLIEVLVALTITAMVVLAGRGIADQLALTTRATTRAVDARLEEISRDVELRRMFRLAATPLDTSMAFSGGEDHIELTTRCTVARGWDEPCRCRVSVQARSLPATLTRACSTSSAIDTLATDSLRLSLRYLLDAGRGGQWLREWGRSITPPIAIGVVRAASGDTLIIRLGTRG